MPAQVADWSQVKATAIALGNLLHAAEQHGISYESVRVRAHREQWPVGRRVHKLAQQAQDQAHKQIVLASRGTVTSVTSTAQALENTLREGANETRIGLTRYAAKMAKQAADTGILEQAPLYKAVADIHAKIHPSAAEMHVRISGSSSPIIDIDAELVQDSEQQPVQ